MATGTGLPVNTYKSFLVNSTDNPVGYNTATGLYTHPNGDYWMETGNTISEDPSIYPDATYFSAPTGRTLTGSFRQGVGAAWISDDKIVFKRTTSTPPVYEEWSFVTGAATGVTYTLPSVGTKAGILCGFVVDRTNSLLWIMALSNNNGSQLTYPRFTCFNFAGVQQSTYQMTALGTTTSKKMGGWHNDGANVSDIAYVFQNTSNVWQYYKLDFSGGSGVQPTATAITGPNSDPFVNTGDGYFSLGPSYGGTKDTFYNRNGSLRTWTGGVALGSSLSPIGGNSTNSNFTNKNWAVFNNATTVYEYGPAFGDSTARTDSDSGQPLFLKIK